MQCTAQNKLKTWKESHHSSSLNLCRRRGARGNTEDCFSLQHDFSTSPDGSFHHILTSTLWRPWQWARPAGWGRQWDDFGGVSSPVRPETSVTVRVTTARVQFSIRKAGEAEALEAGEGGSEWWRPMGKVLMLLHHHFTGLGVWDRSLSQWESLLALGMDGKKSRMLQEGRTQSVWGTRLCRFHGRSWSQLLSWQTDWNCTQQALKNLLNRMPPEC